MRRSSFGSLVGVGLLAIAPSAWAAIDVNINGTISPIGPQGGNSIAIFGNSYHVNPGSIVTTPGALQEYDFSDTTMNTQTATFADTTPEAENWGAGAPASLGAQVDNFAVRWEGFVNVPTGGTFNLSGGADDRFRAVVDGRVVFNDRGRNSTPGTVTLSSGDHAISWWFREDGGGAGYNANIPIAGRTYTATTQHPFASYALEIETPVTQSVNGALRYEIYNGADHNARTVGSLVNNQIYHVGPGVMDWTPGGGPGAGRLFAGTDLNTTPLVGDSYGVRAIGEIFFTAGTHSIGYGNGVDDRYDVLLDLDNNGFSQVGADWVGSSSGGSTGGNSFNIATDGYYPIRFDYFEGGGGSQYEVTIDGVLVNPANFQMRSTGAGNEWLEFANSLTPVGDALTTGQLGTLNWESLGLTKGQTYNLRLRTFDVAGREVAFNTTVLIPEPAMLGALSLIGLLMGRRRTR